MKTSDPAATETLRAIIRAIPDGIALRKAPTVSIDAKVLRWVFGPAQALLDVKKKARPAKPSPT